MKSKIKSLSQIIEDEKGLENLRKTAKEYSAVDRFFEIFPKLNKTVTPKKVEKNILFLRVDNSALRNELFLKQNEIIKTINDYIGEEIIKGIRFSK